MKQLYDRTNNIFRKGTADTPVAHPRPPKTATLSSPGPPPLPFLQTYATCKIIYIYIASSFGMDGGPLLEGSWGFSMHLARRAGFVVVITHR